MFKKIFSLITVFCLYASCTSAHGIHISYGQAELRPDGFSGKITFYKNDFMDALKTWNHGNLNNLSASDFTRLKENYLEYHVKLYADGELLKLVLYHNNEDENSIWFEFRYSFTKTINEIKFVNSVLFNEFSDQMNLLNIKLPAGDKSLILKKNNPAVSLKLE